MLNLVDLTTEVRDHMTFEFADDLKNGRLYLSPRLTDAGKEEWPQLLSLAITEHDDRWLESELSWGGLLLSREQRRKPRGGYTMARVPYTAAQTLSEGEFNRYYIRGVCLCVLGIDGTEVEVYRAKEVTDPRVRSLQLIGQLVNASEVLNDLRINDPENPMLGIPGGPNSGISVKIPD